MSTWKRTLRAALLGGVAIAGSLATMSFAFNPDRQPALFGIVMIAQFPGYLVCALFCGGSIESINAVNFIEIAFPVNAAFYAMILLGALQFWRTNQRGNAPGNNLA